MEDKGKEYIMSIPKIFFFSFFLLLAITSATTTIFPLGLGKIILLCLLPYFFIKILNFDFNFFRINLKIFFLMIIIYLYVYFHTIYFHSIDFSHSYIFLLNIIEFMLVSLIISHIFAKYMTNDRYIVLKIFVLASFINSIIVYINIIMPSSRILIQSIMPVAGNLPPDYFFRTGGLSNGPGASLSIFHSLGSVVAYFLLSKSKNIKRKFLFSFLTIFILGSTLFISRTGFFLFFMIIGFYSIFFNILKIKLLFVNIIYLLLSSILSGVFLYFVLNIILDSNQIYLFQERFIPWAFELFISYFNSGEISSASTNDLIDNHFFLPDNVSSLFFGEAYYLGIGGNGHYIPSDSGYVRSIFSIGIIGSIIAYSFFPIVLFIVYKYFLDKSIYKLLVTIIIMLLVVEIKMPFMYVGKVNLILYIVIFSEIQYFYKQKRLLNAL